jgi:hypothetical protein
VSIADKDWVNAMLAMIAAAVEGWRHDAEKRGIICGHRYHCTVAATVLAAVAGSMQARDRVNRVGLLDIAEDILNHRDDKINELAARIEQEIDGERSA